MWLFVVYAVLVVVLSAHGGHRLLLSAIWLVRGKQPRALPPPLPPEACPRVTVQLPVFNERDVIVRAVEALTALRWPAHRLQIQVLDDSTDDTGERAKPALDHARSLGIDVVLVRRTGREGFKAGALAHGLQSATGELIAIFDADFVPDPDFLERLVPHFGDPQIGMVQGRWTHLNAGRNPLTGAQAMMLDGHFVIEHAARSLSGCWTHFNGTAGIWRRTCIESGGGWQHDTLTEDLDLSYRAQLAGWRFVYRPDVTVPAELPESLAAFRLQQHRWAKGSIETLMKLGPRVLRAPAPKLVRAEAMAHLCANLAWPLALLLAVLMPAAVALRPGEHTLSTLMLELPAFGLSVASNVVYYGLATGPRAELGRLGSTLLLGIGLSVGQAGAVFEALTGRKSAFLRTPKTGGGPGSYGVAELGSVGVELTLAAWNLLGAGWALYAGRLGAVPFLLMFALGFGWVGVAGWRQRPRRVAAWAPTGQTGRILPGK